MLKLFVDFPEGDLSHGVELPFFHDLRRLARDPCRLVELVHRVEIELHLVVLLEVLQRELVFRFGDERRVQPICSSPPSNRCP